MCCIRHIDLSGPWAPHNPLPIDPCWGKKEIVHRSRLERGCAEKLFAIGKVGVHWGNKLKLWPFQNYIYNILLSNVRKATPNNLFYLIKAKLPFPCFCATTDCVSACMCMSIGKFPIWQAHACLNADDQRNNSFFLIFHLISMLYLITDLNGDILAFSKIAHGTLYMHNL